MTKETQDLLAEQARRRGVSLLSMLAELARDDLLDAEREASRADADSREVAAEERAWESTLGDGID